MPSGRPSRYKKEYAEQARKLCLLGYKDTQLADFFEIQESTLNNWKKKHPEFMESLKAGKDLADVEVADTLYNRALGKVKVSEDKISNSGELIKTERELAPDVTSMIFWLKNRQPELWRDKKEEAPRDSLEPIGKVQIEVVGANSIN